MTIKNGMLVRVKNEGSMKYPIAQRYIGRTGAVIDVRKSGNTTLVELEIHDRVTPLLVTASSLEVF